MAFVTTSLGLCAQSLDGAKCYVVVGAFKIKSNAESFTAAMQDNQLSAKYELNSNRDLYYVYTYESVNKEEATSQLIDLRANNANLNDAWLYIGNFSSTHSPALAMTNEEQEEIEEPVEVEEDSAIIEEEPVEEPVAEEPEEEEGIYWKVVVDAHNAKNEKEIDGKFLVFDAERNQQLQEIETNKLQKIQDPSNRTNRVRIESDIFGFHSIRHTLDLDKPEESDPTNYVDVKGDTIELNFKLQRMRKGDIMALWKVYFFTNAAIMQKESLYELNQLLAMMEENENMVIKIHGHTNGNSYGDVIHLNPEDKQFFSLNGDHITDYSSARKLSEYRAYTIQHWLMEQGIPEERMKIKGWGGKKMIYDKHDSQADKNVRVEIEIIKD